MTGPSAIRARSKPEDSTPDQPRRTLSRTRPPPRSETRAKRSLQKTTSLGTGPITRVDIDRHSAAGHPARNLFRSFWIFARVTRPSPRQPGPITAPPKQDHSQRTRASRSTIRLLDKCRAAVIPCRRHPVPPSSRRDLLSTFCLKTAKSKTDSCGMTAAAVDSPGYEDKLESRVRCLFARGKQHPKRNRPPNGPALNKTGGQALQSAQADFAIRCREFTRPVTHPVPPTRRLRSPKT